MLLIYRTNFAVSDTRRSLSCTFPSPEGRDPHYYVVVTGLRKKNEFVSRLRSNNGSAKRTSHLPAIVVTRQQCEHCIGVEGHCRQHHRLGTTHACPVVAVPICRCSARMRAEARPHFTKSTPFISYAKQVLTGKKAWGKHVDSESIGIPIGTAHQALEHRRTLSLHHHTHRPVAQLILKSLHSLPTPDGPGVFWSMCSVPVFI